MLKSMATRTGIVGVLFVFLALNVSVAAPGPASRGRPTFTEADVEAKLARMHELLQKNRRKEVAEEFKGDDLMAWVSVFKDRTIGTQKAGEALHLRGTSFAAGKDYARAEKDLKFALELSPSNGYMWNSLGGVYRSIKDDDKALDAYNKAFEFEGTPNGRKSYGWMPISSTMSAASILMHQTKCREALQTLERYNDEDIGRMSVCWAAGILRAYGKVYLAMGREEEGLAKFKAALELENKKGE